MVLHTNRGETVDGIHTQKLKLNQKFGDEVTTSMALLP